MWIEDRGSGKKLRKRPVRRVMFRLAGHLGCTVAELEQRLSSSELTEWVALAWLDPWGEYRADVRGAVAAWASVAAWSSQSKVQDFLPADPCAIPEPKSVESKPAEQKKVASLDELAAAKMYLTSLGLVPVKGTDNG
jgi:hypothetical protein